MAKKSARTRKSVGKVEICEFVSREVRSSTSQVKEIYELIMMKIESALLAGDSVCFKDFGTLQVRTRKPRIATSLKGAKIAIPEKKAVFFKNGRGLKKNLNGK